MTLRDRIKKAWNVFRFAEEQQATLYSDIGPSYSVSPSQMIRPWYGASEQTIMESIKTRIAVDCAGIEIRHVRVNEEGRYLSDIDSSLNERFLISSNKDQVPRNFFQSVVSSMLDDGVVAIFPEDADFDPIKTGSYQIYSLRRGRISEWYSDFVEIETFDPTTMLATKIVLPKEIVAIVENPLYSVVNAPNSTLQRLIHKLALLDAVDNQTSSGKMDLIIQLPYLVRNEIRQEQAEQRRKSIEMQLTNSKYGIAYIDGTERITQLNRPVENNLLSQIEYLNNMLYSQIGITSAVFDGTASEQEQLNYNNRIIEPIVAAIVDEMKRKFLTKTARSQGQSIMYFRNPFKLAPVAQVAELGDKLTRNEILTSNEFRAILGYRPSSDPKADELRNSNIAASKQGNEENIAPQSGTDYEPPQE